MPEEPDMGRVTVNGEEMTIEQVFALIDLLLPFLDEEDKENLLTLKEQITEFSDSDVARAAKNLMNIQAFAAMALEEKLGKVIDDLAAPLREQVTNLQKQFTGRVTGAKDSVLTAVFKKCDEFFGSLQKELDTMQVGITSEAILFLYDEAQGVLEDTYEAMKNELRQSANKSLQENIIKHVNGFIDTLLYQNTVVFVKTELINSASGLVTGKFDSKRLVNAATKELPNLAAQSLGKVNPDNIINGLSNFVWDIFDNYKWGNIKDEIFKGILDIDPLEMITAFGAEAAKEQLTNLAENLAGKVEDKLPEGLAADVEIDFGALAQGDLTGAIKFAEIFVEIKSKPVDIEGYLSFKNDDPIWGDCWEARLKALIRIPDDKNPVLAEAIFLNGTTMGGDNGEAGYKYWFVELNASGLNTQIIPSIGLDGLAGRIYHHLRKDETKQYFPDKSLKFGAGLSAFFFDIGGDGQSFTLLLGLDLVIEDEGFIIELNGDINIANANVSKTPETGIQWTIGSSVAYGYGYIQYNSMEKHFCGSFKLTVDKSPLLCAGAETFFDISKQSWRVAMGTRENPCYIDVLCLGSPIFEGWLDVSNRGVRPGAQGRLARVCRKPLDWLYRP
ncbi:MAG: hypothetical protein HC896_01710 [Bacteroidales bacterium]|nr:hypothetical protein [Bacteroidales bacterium]